MKFSQIVNWNMWNRFYSKKLPPAFTTASMRGRKRLQAFATVALGRLAITSVILAISEAAVL